jgi:hypothetical protein
MSVQMLETIKQQIALLSEQEQAALADYLRQQAEQKTPRNGRSHEDLAAVAPSSPEDKAEVRRQQQMQWMKSNAQEHGGQYVALIGDQLIATGRTFREVNEAIRAAGKRDAFVTYLPKPDEVIEMGGWL